MVVGICRVVLALPWNDSLKGKRSVVKCILERTRQRFHVAAAEVEDLDAHRRATLGFSVVSNDVRHAQSVLDKVVSFLTDSQAKFISQLAQLETICRTMNVHRKYALKAPALYALPLWPTTGETCATADHMTHMTKGMVVESTQTSISAR